MKKNKSTLSIIVAVVVFILALVITSPAPSAEVAVAALDLPAGHTIAPTDIEMRRVPNELLPPEGAVEDPNLLIGETLAVNRSVGDLVLLSHLGEALQLAPDERAIAVTVDNSSGLAGMLQNGDMVGVVAIIFQRNSGSGDIAYSKVAVEGLKVFFQDPMFDAIDPLEAHAVDELTGLSVSPDRNEDGAVVLVVNTKFVSVLYDCSGEDQQIGLQQVNTLELLASLDAAENAQFRLYKMGDDAEPFTTCGLFLPQLMPMPTPTPTLDPLQDSVQPGTPEN